MKYLVASDIHGSEFYCKKVLEAFEREGADRLILLGDLLYHGARNDLPKDYSTKGVTALLNSYADKIFAVRGNCDSEVDQMVLNFPIMADYMLLVSGERLIFVTHGHLFNTENRPKLKKGDVLLHGHTHVRVCQDAGDFTYINPGSVSIPKDNMEGGYMTVEDGVFTWKLMDGTVTDSWK
ncbi:MAG: phosphodiesterase [Clostridiales bacterium]|nr:phosphodiesterase [Clostridiales bacterium]MBQ4638329.1 phosphodiesterase [Clostridia bacterium]